MKEMTNKRDLKMDIKVLKFRTIRLLLLTLSLLVNLSGCGGGGGGGGGSSGGGGDVGGGWVTIDQPTTETTYSTVCNSVELGGEAFISPTWWRCCSGSAEDTGVTVTWKNMKTGTEQKAYQSIDICYFLGSPYLCNHRWSATVPLALGDNLVTITASDPSGVTGQDSITVSKPILSYSVSGRVTTSDGAGLFLVRLTLTDTDPVMYATTGADGYYGFTCVRNGAYTITPSLTGYSFNPESRDVTVNNADITGQDFVKQ